MAATAFYILVNSTTEGMALYQALRARACKVRISPAPRGVQVCCGASLLVEPQDMPAVRAALQEPDVPGYVDIVELPNQINPHRDVYC